MLIFDQLSSFSPSVGGTPPPTPTPTASRTIPDVCPKTDGYIFTYMNFMIMYRNWKLVTKLVFKYFNKKGYWRPKSAITIFILIRGVERRGSRGSGPPPIFLTGGVQHIFGPPQLFAKHELRKLPIFWPESLRLWYEIVN